MVKGRLGALFVVAGCSAACGSTEETELEDQPGSPTDEGARVVDFEDMAPDRISPYDIDRRSAARDDKLARNTITPAEILRRQKMIRSYFLDARSHLDIVHTSVTPSGQTVDWVKAPDVDWSRVPPPPSESLRPAEGPNGEPAGRAQFELEGHPELWGPLGTVPVARFDVDSYLGRVAVPPASISDLFQKPQASLEDHYYVGVRRDTPTLGVAAEINYWNNDGPSPSSEFTLGQVAVSRNSGLNLQTVEAGWIEYEEINGDTRPKLFIFYTTNGYDEQGHDKGGWNQMVRGWIQVHQWAFPGADIGSSTTGGYQRDLHVVIKKEQVAGYEAWPNGGLGWWIYANGYRLGYYPTTLFASSGLESVGGVGHWYGEVNDSEYPTPPDTDMGSGEWPSAGYRYAAYMRILGYYDAGYAYHLLDNGSYPPTSYMLTDPSLYGGYWYCCYSGGWYNRMWWGGPGAD